MRHPAWQLMAVALLGCGGDGLRPPNPSLVGEWVMMGDVLEFPIACGSHGPVTYHEDGIYSLWGEVGTWRLDGKVLTETMTSFEPMHVDRSARDVGKPQVSTLQWADQNAFLKRYANGETRAFRRCPDRH